MVGNSGDGGSNLGSARGGLPGDADEGSAPVLGGVSEAELEAFVSKLRTDKNRIATPVAQPRSHMGERLHRGRPLVSSVPEEGTSHAWYVALGSQVSGPHDVAALKGYWERGELGADSLCWRDGFSAWQPLCQVPELADALVPLPQERLPMPDEVPVDMGTYAPGFELKGAEALRSLSEEPALAASEWSSLIEGLDAALPTEVVDGLQGTPGAGATQGPVEGCSPARSGSVDPAWTQAQVDNAGTHAVLGTTQAANRGGFRWRRAVWLALLGGVAGGVTVTLLLGVLGTAQGRALLDRLGGRAAMRATGSAVGGATPASTPSGNAVASASPASGSGVSTSAAGGAAPGAVGTVAGQGVSGNAPAVSGTGPTAGTVTSAAPTVTGATAASRAPAGAASSGAVAGSALALEKRPVAPPPVDDAAPEAELEVEAAPAVEEKPAAVLGPDEDFERELADPPAGDEDPLKERTVYVPPDPAKPAASLAQSDIFEVVLANKGDISACAAEQQPPSDGGGRVVVRWSILPSGQVGEVVTETAALKGTSLARCIEGRVRAWTFPKHAEQGGPVRFPFVF